jgi:hypothetical protein
VDLNPHDTEKLHIHHTVLAGIHRGAANGRISAALVHHSWPLATFRMSMPIPDRKVRWGFLVLTGYALRPGHKERQ